MKQCDAKAKGRSIRNPGITGKGTGTDAAARWCGMYCQ